MSEIIEPHERVNFPCGKETIGGEIFSPPNSDAASILLIPDVHGLSDLYRRLASRLVRAGYRTLVIDLYTREGQPKLADLPATMAWIANLPDQRILGDLEAGLEFLAASSPRLGVVGFCLGGQYAVMAGCQLSRVTSVVSFYGMLRYAETNDRKPASPLDMAASLKAPLLGLYGEEDPLVPPADVEQFAKILDDEGKHFEHHIYAGAGHAFLNDTRPDAYREAAADDAWQRALAFLAKHLSY